MPLTRHQLALQPSELTAGTRQPRTLREHTVSRVFSTWETTVSRMFLPRSTHSDVRYIRGTSQNVRLHRTEWIVAGVSKTLTVTPDDTLCSNNLQDPSFGGPTYVCRSVRVVAPSDGVMTVEAVSTQDRTHPPLEVETVGGAPCCFERMANPVSIPVTAGTEVLVNVEMASGSTTSQSFTLTTSMTP